MYTIKRAAEVTDVAEATLRAWERRYGVVTPGRTDAGYRIYDDADLERVRQMRDLVAQGWAPRQAAERVVGSTADGGTPPPREDFIAAAAAIDATALGSVLERAMESTSFEVFVQDWLMPVLADLGMAWTRGEVSVAGEHLAASTIQRALARVFDAEGRHSAGQRVLVGLPAGAHHELGVFAFAALARRRGLDVLYAGADLPVADWVDVASRDAIDAAVLAVPMPGDVSSAQETVDALRAARPSLVVAVGGGHQHRVEGGILLGQLINGSVDQLVSALRHGTSRANTTMLST